ncbi:MAG: hypothetical protein KC443_09920, partial [Anaerolineales bacterium]|nr:hypothetical protein [Anaerolineales bacterium]
NRAGALGSVHPFLQEHGRPPIVSLRFGDVAQVVEGNGRTPGVTQGDLILADKKFCGLIYA